MTKLLEETSQGHNEGKLRGVRRIGHQRTGVLSVKIMKK